MRSWGQEQEQLHVGFVSLSTILCSSLPAELELAAWLASARRRWRRSFRLPPASNIISHSTKHFNINTCHFHLTMAGGCERRLSRNGSGSHVCQLKADSRFIAGDRTGRLMK